MSASPAAAPAPARKVCGSGQNVGRAAQMAMQVMVTAIIVVNGEDR
jgi:hypothetical protein